MNIPANIDLTERRDFGNDIIAIGLPYDPDYDDYSLMTSEEYDFICWFDGIFGKRRHKTSKYKLFHEDEANPYKDDEIPIRFPWGSAMNGFVLQHRNISIPWNLSTVNNFTDRRLDLFNMR